MYPSSSSSSHSSPSQSTAVSGGGLKRYDSAPSSFLTAAVDSVIRQPRHEESSSVAGHRYFSSESASAISSESNCNTTPDHMRSYGNSFQSPSNTTPLVRHSSLPAGFLNRVASAVSTDNGFSVIRGIGGSYNSHGGSDSSSGIHRLNSQLSFTRHDSLSQITEESEDADEDIHAEGNRQAAHTFATASFGMGWDNSSSTIMFSGRPGKRAKNDNGGGLNMMESQFQFGLSQSGLDLASMEHMIDIPQDSAPCKARAKRGFATHPRSIAERERRTRISGKLKKLQDLVPNMDKQTSYADMLDLAVQHIKGLQTQVQILNTDLEHCTCGCKQTGQCNR